MERKINFSLPLDWGEDKIAPGAFNLKEPDDFLITHAHISRDGNHVLGAVLHAIQGSEDPGRKELNRVLSHQEARMYLITESNEVIGMVSPRFPRKKKKALKKVGMYPGRGIMGMDVGLLRDPEHRGCDHSCE